MELIRKKIYYSNCSLEEVKELIRNKEAYPVVYPHLLREDDEYYPDVKYENHLSRRNKYNDGVEVENIYSFWRNKKEVIEWLDENYDGLVYQDMNK